MAFSGEHMIARKENGVGWITFNNPQMRNAFTLDMWLDMAELLTDFNADPDVRVTVLSGAGGVSFAAGAGLIRVRMEPSSTAPDAACFAGTDGASAGDDFAAPPLAAAVGPGTGLTAVGLGKSVCCLHPTSQTS